MSDLSRTLRQEVVRLQEENRALREEVLSLRQYLDSLHALSEAINQFSPDQEIMPLLDRILYNAMLVINAKDGSLLVLDEETDELVFVLARGEVEQDQLTGHRVPPGKGIAGWVVSNRKPTIVNNAPADSRFYAGVDQTFHFQTNSVLAAPIVGGDRVLGVIEVLNKHNRQPFNSADQTLMVLLCRFAGEVLYRMVTEEQNQTGKT